MTGRLSVHLFEWGQSKVLTNKLPNTVLALKSCTVDLEFRMLKIEKGRTYHNDGISVFDVYVEEGLKDGSFARAKRSRDMMVVSADYLFKS
jgi:hypothetical protein